MTTYQPKPEGGRGGRQQPGRMPGQQNGQSSPPPQEAIDRFYKEKDVVLPDEHPVNADISCIDVSTIQNYHNYYEVM